MFNTYAGHGGIDGGCSSADGVPEKGINLNIVLCLRDLFTANGYDVKLTRDDDRSIHDDGIEGIANQKSSDMDNRLEILTNILTQYVFQFIKINLQTLNTAALRCSIPIRIRKASILLRLYRIK